MPKNKVYAPIETIGTQRRSGQAGEIKTKMSDHFKPSPATISCRACQGPRVECGGLTVMMASCNYGLILLIFILHTTSQSKIRNCRLGIAQNIKLAKITRNKNSNTLEIQVFIGCSASTKLYLALAPLANAD